MEIHYKVTINFWVCIFITLSSLWVSTQAFSQALPIGLVELPLGMRIGQGYDHLTAEPRGDCLDFEIVSAPSPDQHYFYSELQSSSKLVQRTDLEATALLKATFSASGSFKLLRDINTTVYDYHVLLESTVQTETVSAKNVRLKDEFRQLFQSDQPAFERTCGTSYVSVVLKGGYLYGVVDVETESINDKEDIKVKVGGSKGIFEGNAEFDRETEEILTSSKTHIVGYESGALEPNPVTFETMKTSFQTHPTRVKESGGIPIKMKLQQYPIFPKEGNYNKLYQLAVNKWDLLTGKQEILYIIQHPQQFLMPNMSEWQNKLLDLDQRLDMLIAEVDTATDECLAKPATCKLPAAFSLARLRTQFPPRFQSVCGGMILPLSTDACLSDPSLHNCGSPPNFTIALFPIAHVRGDAEMDGHSPHIRVESIMMTQGPRQLNAQVTVFMQEAVEDFTTFESIAIRQVLNIGQTFPGCLLNDEGILDKVGKLETQAGEDDHDFHTYRNATGHLNAAIECRSDTPGDETGEIGCKLISFQKVEIRLSHEEEGLTPSGLVQSALLAFAGEEELDAQQVQQKEEQWDRYRASLRELLGDATFFDLFGDFSPMFLLPSERPNQALVQWRFDAAGNPLPSSTVNLTIPQIGDLDSDGDVDRDDLEMLLQDLGKSVSQSACGARCDLNGDGQSSNLDVRELIQLCSRPQCAKQ
jgi:hypothetical protein